MRHPRAENFFAKMKVPFNRLTISGKEFEYMRSAAEGGQLHGDGRLTAACHGLLAKMTGCAMPLLTTSCTSALDMAAILCSIRPGDEVIMPSYTFVSTANAFALRGAKIVWCDIREDTANIDETLIEPLITGRTRAIVPVHYAGVACEMDAIMGIAKRHSLAVVEDAAQGICSSYRGRALGSIGDFGALSFHGTKNLTCGEGGAILVNNPEAEFRACVVREKGTNRTEFMQGKADKYTWVDYGSSFLPSELSAGYLLAQLENAGPITRDRLAAWDFYFARLAPLADAGMLKLPTVPEGCAHNAHIFYFLARSAGDARRILAHMKERGVGAASHYVPLHSSPMGMKVSEPATLPVCDSVAARLVRLPIFSSISREEQEYVCASLEECF